MPDNLCCLAEREGVAVETWPLEFPLFGLYYSDPALGKPVIAVSHQIVRHTRILRTVLAEELGHHFTSAGVCFASTHCSYHHRLNVTRAEERALRWAALYLMPSAALTRAIRGGIVSIYGLADYFRVTERLVRFRLDLSRKIGEVLWEREIA